MAKKWKQKSEDSIYSGGRTINFSISNEDYGGLEKLAEMGNLDSVDAYVARIVQHKLATLRYKEA